VIFLLCCLLLNACRSSQATALPPAAAGQPAAVLEFPFAPLKASAPNCHYGGEFKSIEALDADTVQFSLCYPDAAFLNKIASPAFAIQPSSWLEQAAGSIAFLQHPIGTGPYQVKSWASGSELVLLRFEEYWGEKARTPQLIFRWDQDATQRLNELLAGRADGIDGVSADDYAVIQSNDVLLVKPRAGMDIFYVGLNNTAAPFDNEKVRQAIAMAIDRRSIVEKFFPMDSSVADFFTPCIIPYACQGESWYSYDPGRAKALLTEAGYPNGFAAQLAYRNVVRSYLPDPAAVAKEIQNQLAINLGISLNLVGMESDVFLASADAGELKGLFLMGLSANYPDPGYLLDFHFGIGASSQFGKPSADLAKWIKAGGETLDAAVREANYREANNWIRQHVPVIPVAHSASLAVFQSTVRNAQASPVHQENFAVMENGKDTFTWLEAQEPFSLYCADETDLSAIRACAQVTETLYRYGLASASVEPGLALGCTASPNLQEWVCDLRPGVKFHDASTLDANDVVMSFKVQWQASDPLHRGRTGEFIPFQSFFGAFLP
jgi:peptide/nickel transport system substrate-binding protein